MTKSIQHHFVNMKGKLLRETNKQICQAVAAVVRAIQRRGDKQSVKGKRYQKNPLLTSGNIAGTCKFLEREFQLKSKSKT